MKQIISPRERILEKVESVDVGDPVDKIYRTMDIEKIEEKSEE